MTEGSVGGRARLAASILQQYQRIAAKMYTLDAHGGRRFLREATVTGATALLADEVNRVAPVVWAQFNELRRLTDTIPTGDSGSDAEDDRLLEALFTDDAVQLDAHGLPVSHTDVTAHSSVTLHAFATDIETACDTLLRQCDDVDTACGDIADRAGAITTDLDAVTAEAATAGMSDNSTLQQLQQRRQHHISAAMSDPLTAVTEPDLDRLAADIADFADRTAELKHLHHDHAKRLERLRDAVTALATAEREAADACALAAAKIAQPVVPTVEPQAAGLSAALLAAERLAAEAQWHTLAQQLTLLNQQTSEAAQRSRQCRDTAAALLDRRAELRGRFAAYSRKAARIGVIETPEVSKALDTTRRLLQLAPCDLPAATTSLRLFQQAISAQPKEA